MTRLETANDSQTVPLPSMAGETLPTPEHHIVDILIEERAEHLRANKFIWWLTRKCLYPALQYRQAVDMADAIARLNGHDVMTELSRRIPVKLQIDGLDHVPATGPVMIVGNHPSGIVDGIALYNTLMKKRSDICFFANRDAIRVAPGLLDLLIPVEWVEGKRSRLKTKEALQFTTRAFNQGKAVVIFPSGGIAQFDKNNQLREKAWLTSAISMIRKYEVPAIPLHITARNSWLYYFFHKWNDELRNITLFHEMLNKAGQTFKLKFGPAIPHEALTGDTARLTAHLQHYVEFDLLDGKPFTPDPRLETQHTDITRRSPP